MYVERDKDGNIVTISREATADCKEYVASDSLEISLFLGNKVVIEETDQLRESDLEFVRVLEDVIEVLMNKGLISFTDLPDAARDKLLTRQNLRRRVNDVGLMDDSDSGVI
ncbi:tryptophan synthase subunit beta like protein [Halomonas sp. 1513]|nr:tryptophan synthase subunit beta like protein [Halomonas sp. 1513]APX92886.1 tryptophan synthase subunit beta like protein [Halomonas sp. 1513]